jgi:HEAT repeat protein
MALTPLLGLFLILPNEESLRNWMSDDRMLHMRVSTVMVWALLPCLLLGCAKKPPYEGKSAAELERMVQSNDTARQVQGAYGLSQLGHEAKPAVPSLIDALKSPEALVRQNAALALGTIGSEAKEAVPGLSDALNDSEWTVRRQAAVSLGQIGPDAAGAVPKLQQLQKDPNDLVRRAAQDAIGKINSRPK